MIFKRREAKLKNKAKASLKVKNCRFPAYIEALEPRLLYSADLLGGTIDVSYVDPDVLDEAKTRLSILAKGNHQDEQSGPHALTAQLEENQPIPDANDKEVSGVELVIIDASTPDYQILVNDIINNAADGTQFQLVVIDSQDSGIKQISEVLSQYTDLDALHLISHGEQGQLNIGNTRLSQENLEQYSAEISAWSGAFKFNGDILLYGCNLAAELSGQAFIDALAVLTKTDVAASNDLTGHAEAGGDWQLEYHTGVIDTELAVSESLQVQWQQVLANDPASANDDPVTYSTYISSLNPVSHWQLNESSGTLVLDQAGSNNGTYVNAPGLAETGALVDDPANTAVSFDGTTNDDSGDYIVIPHDSDMMLDDGSIQLWFNTDNVMQDSSLFSKDSSGYVNGGHIEIDLTSSGHINVRLQSSSDSYFVETTEVMTNSQWHNVVFTFGSSGMKLYVDGELADTNVYTGGLGTTSGGSGNSEPIVIGASTGVSNSGSETPTVRHYQGKIDEVAIFDSALSAEQIKMLYGSALQDYTLLEDGTLNVSADAGVLANDYDAENDPLTAILVSGPSNAASFSLNADGSFTYTPTANFSGTDSFSYKVNDGTSDSNIATVTLTVTGVDDQTATVVNQSMTVAEGATDTVLTLTELQSTDTDTDDSTLIYTVGNVSNGTLTINGSAWASGSNDTFTQQDIIDGNIRYSHDDSNTTSDNFSYTVEDPAGNQLTGQSFTITVTPVDDDTATVVNQSMTVAEGAGNTALTLTELQSTDADTLDSTLIYTVGNVSNGTLTINGSAWASGSNDTFSQQDIIDGNVLYAHDGSNTTSDSFSYTVEDPAGNRLTGQSFAITVTPEDDTAAIVVNQSMTVAEGDTNTVLTLTELQSTDADTDDSTLIYTVGNVSNGTLTINGSAWAAGSNDTFTQQDIIDGNILYSHDGSNTSSDNFSYTVEDPAGNQLTGQSFAITVTPVDSDTATVVNQSMTVAEGATDTVLTLTELQSTDTDTDDSTLIYTVGNVSNGTLTINGSAWASGSNDTFTQQDIIDGNIRYSHDDSNTTSDSFSYTVEDPAGNQLTGQSFTITVTPVDDDTATVVNQSMTVAEGAGNTALTLTELQSTDADTLDSTLIYTVGNVSNGTLTINGSAWASGSNDTFSQQDIIDGNVLYAHDGSNTTSDSFSYTVEDPAGNRLTGQSFVITVTPEDDTTAIVVNQSMTVAEGDTNTVLTLTELQSTDADTDDSTLIYTVGNVSNGTLTINGSVWAAGSNDTFTQQDIIDGNILYSHDGSNTISDNFSYTVEDPAGNQLTGQSFAITVTPVDSDTATVVNQSMAVAEGATDTVLTLTELQSTDTDTDDSTLIYTVTDVSHGTLYINGSVWYKSGIGANNTFSQQDIIDGKVRYSHDGSNTLSDNFGYTVEDGAGNQLTGQSFTITISAEDDDTAAAVNQSMTVAEGASNTALTLTELQSTDADTLDSTLIYTVGNVSNGTLTINGSTWASGSNDSFSQQDIIDGKVLYSHDGSNTLSDHFTYSVEDGAGNRLSGQSFVITVTPVDDDIALVIKQSLTVTEGDSNIALSLNELQSTDADSDDAALLYTVGNVSNGTLTINGSAWAQGSNDSFTQQDILDGKVLYSHDDSNTSTDSFSFSVTDPAGNQLSDQNFVIQVNRIDDDPAMITSNISFSGNEGDIVSGILSATDVDGLTDSSYFSAGHGVYGSADIDAETGVWFYTPTDNNWFGTDSFTVTVTDDFGGITEQLVTVTLTGVDDAALISGDLYFSGTEGDWIGGDINASDVDGLTDLSYFSVGPASHGQVVIDTQTGNWVYTARDSNWFGSDSFHVTVTDDFGGITTELIRIELTAVNDAAIISGQNNAILLLADDSDGELVTSGQLTIVDADEGEAAFVAETFSGRYGELNIDSQGHWFYHANASQPAIRALGENETVTEQLTVSSIDGTEQRVNVAITGVNDAPVITQSLSDQAVNPESEFDLTFSKHTFMDPDTADTLVYTLLQADGSALPGWLNFDSDSLTLSGIADNEDTGTLALKLIADDGSLTTAEAFSLTVNRPMTVDTLPITHIQPTNVVQTSINKGVAENQGSLEQESLQENSLEQAEEITDDQAETSGEKKSAQEVEIAQSISVPKGLHQILNHQHNSNDAPGFSEVAFETVIGEINEVEIKTKTIQENNTDQQSQSLEALDLINLDFSTSVPLELLTAEQVSARDNEHFFRELDQMRRELNESIADEDEQADVVAEVTMGATLSVSMGVLAWVLRAGSLMASFLSIIPLWKQFDLMPVLGSQPVKTPEPSGDKKAGQSAAKEETIFDTEEKSADESKD
ncbi:cadherin-like domain-containing protein [Thalassomonas sp. RHCl1]|uniref:cadherin-like domain-containing protein n=1 Tax=Thalassomonas sp. RHCl1 TaxID=2995320 RepID=UPI00248AF03D|nr:cadherin-like domain-containing protein [Thalassomonas sp. RHCl1]